MRSLTSIRIAGEPLVFILDAENTAHLYCLGLNEAGCRVKTFNKDSIFDLIEEFRAAQPRPDLLITGCLDLSGSGLAAAAACRAINPNLKVLLSTGFPEKDRKAIMAKHPVTVDAIYVKASAKGVEAVSAFMAIVTGLLAAPRSLSAAL